MKVIWNNKLLFAEILLKTYWFRFLLIWKSFKSISNAYPSTGTVVNPKMAAKLRYLITVANRWTFWSNTCLPSVLVARSILNRKGLHSQAFLGMILENGSPKAHAWIQSGDTEVVPSEKNYTKVFEF